MKANSAGALTGQQATKIPNSSLEQRHLSVVEADAEVDGGYKVQDLIDNLCVALDQCCAERIDGTGTPAVAACRLAGWNLVIMAEVYVLTDRSRTCSRLAAKSHQGKHIGNIRPRRSGMFASQHRPGSCCRHRTWAGQGISGPVLVSFHGQGRREGPQLRGTPSPRWREYSLENAWRTDAATD